MASLNIAEFSTIKKVAADGRDAAAQVPLTPTVAVSNVTFTTAAQSNLFNRSTRLVRIISDADCYVLFGTNPTATASNGIKIQADTAEYFGITGGNRLSVYDGSS